MWYTKPSLSASSTDPGWKARREDAELHAPPIHYQVTVTLQQLQLLRPWSRKPHIHLVRYAHTICSRFTQIEAHGWRRYRLRVYMCVDPSPKDPLPTCMKGIPLPKVTKVRHFSSKLGMCVLHCVFRAQKYYGHLPPNSMLLWNQWQLELFPAFFNQWFVKMMQFQMLPRFVYLSYVFTCILRLMM